MHLAYIVHRRRYRESSLLLECFSAAQGRVGVVARGALRGRRKHLQSFQKYQMAWSGRGEPRTLATAEADGPTIVLRGERLFSAMYVNELLMRITTRFDPNVALFELYEQTLAALAHDAQALEPTLRAFEKRLLDVCGYGLQLSAAADSDQAIDPAQRYCYVVEQGPVVADKSVTGCVVSGATLLALGQGSLLDDEQLREAKHLMRFVLRYHNRRAAACFARFVSRHIRWSHYPPHKPLAKLPYGPR